MINHACDLEAYWNRPFCLSNNEWADSDCEFIFYPGLRNDQHPIVFCALAIEYIFFKKSLGDPPCDYCVERWSSNYWNMWTGSRHRPSSTARFDGFKWEADRPNNYRFGWMVSNVVFRTEGGTELCLKFLLWIPPKHLMFHWQWGSFVKNSLRLKYLNYVVLNVGLLFIEL